MNSLGGWFNIKMSSYQYRKSHYREKTILRPFYLHNGISYTDKMISGPWSISNAYQTKNDLPWCINYVECFIHYLNMRNYTAEPNRIIAMQILHFKKNKMLCVDVCKYVSECRHYLPCISLNYKPNVSSVALHLNLSSALRWRHNGHDSVSNHQPHHCLLNRLFGCRSKKTSKLRVTGLCEGNSPRTG